jgi:phosphoribosylformylglycinamidine (FGAM) synthase-like enzyme
MPLPVSGVTRPSSGGSAQLLFGVIACVRCVLTAHRNLHAVNTHHTHAVTPNSNCAEPSEDERVTPETCRGLINLTNELRKVYQVGVDSLT